MKKVLNVIKILVFSFLILFALLSIYQRFIPNGIFGIKTYVIASNSMYPELEVGDVILVKDINVKDIKVGDNLVYQGMTQSTSDKIITHKVESITSQDGEYIFYTKGLANDTSDPAVYEEQIYGVEIYHFITMSFISKIVRSKIGFVICIVIPLLLLFIDELFEVIVEFKQRTKKQ